MRISVLLSLFMIFLFCGCHHDVELNQWEEADYPSVLVDFSNSNLPLKANLPLSDDTLGDFKVQIVNEMDGFIWQVKKGNEFHFQIEDIGVDSHIFNAKIEEMLMTEYMSKALTYQSDSLFVFQYPSSTPKKYSYYIIRRLITNEAHFIISNLETGVDEKYYYKMLQTIRSFRSVHDKN